MASGTKDAVGSGRLDRPGKPGKKGGGKTGQHSEKVAGRRRGQAVEEGEKMDVEVKRARNEEGGFMGKGPGSRQPHFKALSILHVLSLGLKAPVVAVFQVRLSFSL